MEVKLIRKNKAVHFEAVNQNNLKINMDGPDSIGGENKGFSPMELLISGVAGCAGIDVVMILEKQKQKLEDLEITVKAVRNTPGTGFIESITLHFDVWGYVLPNKLEKAIELSIDKYCSAILSLKKDIDILTTYKIHE
ncbi:MAG: OsmC family protein [Flavobacteriaceae bacterium]|nr:OsmC family protein [Flavobacteriaceae bacterium]